MSIIQISRLTFSYPSKAEPVFSSLSLELDSSWKLAFTGRNGKGKTTLLKILENSTSSSFNPLYAYSGSIISQCIFDYFPFEISDLSLPVLTDLYTLEPALEIWKVEREIRKMGMDPTLLDACWNQLSPGERTRIQLAFLFSRDNHFLCIDEPTNHLDQAGRKRLASYLQIKSGFILVSHDQAFLDGCVDHVLAFEPDGLVCVQSGFSQYLENRSRLQHQQQERSRQLKKEISRLSSSISQSASWAGSAENKVYHQGPVDRGFLSAKAARMNKRTKSLEKRQTKALAEKRQLLPALEEIEELKLPPAPKNLKVLTALEKVQVIYDQFPVCKPVTFSVMANEKIALTGQNGVGKSSILHAIAGTNPAMKVTGLIKNNPRLSISYLPQEFPYQNGTITALCQRLGKDESLIKAILRKLGFWREQFDVDISCFSDGQKKKLLIALSLATDASLYIWDEPLNFLDLESRQQLASLLSGSNASFLLVEHDAAFLQAVSARQIEVEKYLSK